MAGPRFSLVVPTRNRARTLAYHLRTCLAQGFGDFEVVVSDNFSPPETRETALSLGDPRIKYFRTPADLSVTDSFEFALEKATGEYITILGDDDGYLLHALKEMDSLLKLVKTAALHWEPVLYSWPDIAQQAYAAPNTLVIPLRQGRSGCALQRYESRPMIEAAANGKISYAELPMVYCCAVVHRDVFERLRRQSGRVFKSRAPDVYVAFAIAHVVDFYYSLAAPLTISGASASSTGIAHLRKSGSAIDEQFLRSSASAGHTWHSSVPDLPSLQATVADSVLHFKEGLAHDTVAIDRRRLIETVLGDLDVESDAAWQNALAACRRSLADDAELLAWFDAGHAKRAMPDRAARSRKQVQRRYSGSTMALDASEHGVSDVMGAAELCEKLLGYKRDGIRVELREQAPGLGDSLTELQEKERQIQAMHRTIVEQQQTIEARNRRLLDLEALLRDRRGLRALVPPLMLRLLRRAVSRTAG